MIDKRIGQRIKECRERIGLTQEQFSEKTGLSVNYISTVERGGSFPRCERLITILNGLQVSADAIFCDVIDHAVEYKENEQPPSFRTACGGTEQNPANARPHDKASGKQ